MKIFYTKSWFLLEIEVFGIGLLMILWKCRSWTESIHVEHQKAGKKKDKGWWKI